MARRPGGSGRKSADIEWAECHRSLYGEAIVSATSMGQDAYTWMNDAIEHHVYRCEQLKAQERYQADLAAAAAGLQPSPMSYDERYQVHRPKPTITKRPGQGSGPPTGRNYRP